MSVSTTRHRYQRHRVYSWTVCEQFHKPVKMFREKNTVIPFINSSFPSGNLTSPNYPLPADQSCELLNHINHPFVVVLDLARSSLNAKVIDESELDRLMMQLTHTAWPHPPMAFCLCVCRCGSSAERSDLQDFWGTGNGLTLEKSVSVYSHEKEKNPLGSRLQNESRNGENYLPFSLVVNNSNLVFLYRNWAAQGSF